MNELKNLTREQLQAMGLNDQQIDAILGATSANEKAGGLPFPLLKVNFDPDLGKVGAYGYSPIKKDKQTIKYEFIVDEIKVRFLKSMYQYSKFDTTENRPTVTSNVFALKNAKKAYDLKTGTSINELKAVDDGIKFQRILLGVLDINGEQKPFIMYAKGSFLFGLNDILRKFPNDGHMTHQFTLGTEKRKKGTVVWFMPKLIDAKELNQQEFISNLKSDANLITEFDKWAEQINSSADTAEEAPNKKIDNSVTTEEDEDEINF